jgi:hypothetical protein
MITWWTGIETYPRYRTLYYCRQQHMSSMSKNGPQWHVTCTMQRIARSWPSPYVTCSRRTRRSNVSCGENWTITWERRVWRIPTSKASWQTVHMPIGMLSKSQLWPKGPHGEPRVHLSPLLDYIVETTHTKVYQAKHARPTQLPLQAIQGFEDDGRGRIKIPYHSGLVVIFGSCF